MPDNIFALSRAPTPSPLPSLYARAPVRGPQVRQSVASQTFSSAPLVGSIVCVLVTANAADTTTRAITGLGVASWNFIAQTAVGGANNTSMATWWGLVSQTPSLAMSATCAGQNTGSAMIELTGLTGTSITSGNASGGGSFSMRATTAGGVMILMGAGTGTLTPSPALFTTAVSATPSRVVYIGYLPYAMQTNTTLATSISDSGGRSNAVAIVLK